MSFIYTSGRHELWQKRTVSRIGLHTTNFFFLIFLPFSLNCDRFLLHCVRSTPFWSSELIDPAFLLLKSVSYCPSATRHYSRCQNTDSNIENGFDRFWTPKRVQPCKRNTVVLEWAILKIILISKQNTKWKTDSSCA